MMPNVRIRLRGARWHLHITYSDGTTHVPVYYPTQAQASFAQGMLHARYTQTLERDPQASVQDLVRVTLAVVAEMLQVLPTSTTRR